MKPSNRVIWIGRKTAPAALIEATDRRWELLSLTGNSSPPGDIAVAVVEASGPQAAMVRRLQTMGVVTMLWGQPAERPSDERFPVLQVAEDISAGELAGRLETAQAIAPTLRRMHLGLAEAHALAREASRTAEEIAEEMQIAQRLQQDFLPRQLPHVGDVRFGVRYLAAGFVSGDIYDVTRLDETHVGFYVADAVGHGMPAALMTMYIKKALQTKRIRGNTYEIIPPNEALSQLNFDLYRQKLSMCEFCTVVYGVIDTQSLIVTLSRAGHPPPIWVHSDGSQESVDMPGTLLGILEDSSFETRRLQLQRGDRLLLYSDGAEEVLCGRGRDKTTEMEQFIEPMTSFPREEFLARLIARAPTSGVEDDVTLLLLDVE